ncbi:kinesin-domain-containing protein [Basidiobolus meristosporus CBS 931.73]|uniref:Kinesin-like protein n=1 Tax=Basidiobolus meristosporus CBS 931.73 TaxID=1314790 RepID=A0A1Y1Z9K2_9FUNG|nr:kinesin-domain-containing protein [Basidiobolus meristosporus CBS 931.73]|eukprot:ORY06953.1 kinesin-domain-containing protein [Basidiobolus meristosporus CBS 931.73]
MPNLNSSQGPLTVQVAVRVRPIQPNERIKGARGNTEVLGYTPEAPIVSVIPHNRQFTYDHVFGPAAGQSDIYSQSVLHLMDKFIQGFNATILAYGQTSSGKTFTMGTGSRKHTAFEAQGIIPRAVNTLFNVLNNSTGNFQVRVSYLEIYNEELIDLLAAYEGIRSQISIREDPRGNIYWTGVREAIVHSPEDVLNYLECGSLARQTGATDMNEKSSRSHAIFSISLRQERMVDSNMMEPSTPTSPTLNKRSSSLAEGDKMVYNSKFHFVDLAGSERLKRTNAIGERAKEGISINAGLLALGNVISALGDQSKKTVHVPYRDSKLTRLLQDSLGGNSYTLMIACVSPVESNLNETLNTLQYANRARNIKNQVVLNSELSGDVDYLRNLVKKLKSELRSIKGESRTSDGGVFCLVHSTILRTHSIHLS